jgi:hypothetical protein
MVLGSLTRLDLRDDRTGIVATATGGESNKPGRGIFDGETGLDGLAQLFFLHFRGYFVTQEHKAIAGGDRRASSGDLTVLGVYVRRQVGQGSITEDIDGCTASAADNNLMTKSQCERHGRIVALGRELTQDTREVVSLFAGDHGIGRTAPAERLSQGAVDLGSGGGIAVDDRQNLVGPDRYLSPSKREDAHIGGNRTSRTGAVAPQVKEQALSHRQSITCQCQKCVTGSLE